MEIRKERRLWITPKTGRQSAYSTPKKDAENNKRQAATAAPTTQTMRSLQALHAAPWAKLMHSRPGTCAGSALTPLELSTLSDRALNSKNALSHLLAWSFSTLANPQNLQTPSKIITEAHARLTGPPPSPLRAPCASWGILALQSLFPAPHHRRAQLPSHSRGT